MAVRAIEKSADELTDRLEILLAKAAKKRAA
jgi:hypothetical protein